MLVAVVILQKPFKLLNKMVVQKEKSGIKQFHLHHLNEEGKMVSVSVRYLFYKPMFSRQRKP